MLLLNVSITRSPPSRDTNSISTRINGLVLTIRQLAISPPTGVMALSMSAAVVPGAKFCAMTLKGPASPRIVRFCAGFGLITLTCALLPPSSMSMRSSAAASRDLRLLAALGVLFLAAAPGAVMREPSEPPRLTVSCRSCVQSRSTLPAGRLARAARGCCWGWGSEGCQLAGAEIWRRSEATFLTPTRLARDGALGADFSLDGALCRRPREKILLARVSFLLRSRPKGRRSDGQMGEAGGAARGPGVPSLMILSKSAASFAIVRGESALRRREVAREIWTEDGRRDIRFGEGWCW